MTIPNPAGRAESDDAPLRVVTIDDRREVREGLAALIDATDDFRCVGRYRSMEEALTALARVAPDIVLLDIDLPGMSGIDGLPRIKALLPEAAILMLTVYDDDDRIFEALCAGACGYLLKKTPPARLLDGLRDAVDGGAPMSPEVARRVVDLFRTFQPPSKADYDLTPHEVRLLKLLADGHSFKSVGAQFGITAHGVSFHMRRIYDKLQVHSKSEAVAKALRHRLLS